MKTVQSNLQKSLNSLHDWCRKNGMVLNTLKTKVMLITSRQKRNNDIDIKMTTSDKILGVYVDENYHGMIIISMCRRKSRHTCGF